MVFTIDTNIVLGFLNPADKLHKKSLRLLDKKEQMILLPEVMIESPATYMAKYNEALAIIIGVIKKVKANVKNNPEAYEMAFLVEYQKYINKNKKRLGGFLNLFYHTILRDTTYDNSLPMDRVSLYAIQTANEILETIQNKKQGTIVYTTDGFYDDRSKILDKIKDVLFKDINDLCIMSEAMVYSYCEKSKLVLFTGDKEFVEKGEEAENKIHRYPEYSAVNVVMEQVWA